MVLLVLAGVACLLGAILQFAAYRSPDVPDNSLVRTARRIGIIAMAIAVLTVFKAASHEAAPNLVYLCLILMGLSQALFAVNNLLPHLEKGHTKWSSHSNNLP